ncbi:stage III sporulation protein AD [Clostridium sp.]|uniref:stage III sporulation protein AD n=1 Tax=Clostridium sp. TaxID=1506 RepID=UPI002A917778|nr:stage III sporulation protein AD [Clostridium sp.]MDY6011793.1 stage III sporulation protein AD [Clostridium sp.]
MSILKVVSFALIALFIYLLFKDKRSDLALLISLVAGTLILIFTIGEIQNIVLFLKSIANKAGIDIVYIGIIMKILAIAYLASFASEICKDAGASTIGSKVEFAGKIMILSLAIPILMAVLDSILKIL